MGVSGSGKTTVGKLLAERLGWHYQEGDALHPPENVAKMSAGTPLTDADRDPWLRRIADRIDAWRSSGEAGVVTCSALKRAYREIIVGDRPDVGLIHLRGSRELIGRRLLPLPLAATVLGCALLTLAAGQVGIALALRVRPGPLLRNE